MAATLRDLRWRVSRPLRDLTTGSATAGTSTTLSDSSRTEADDYWIGNELYIYAGSGSGVVRTVTDYASAGLFTLSPSMATSPTSTSRYELHGRLTKDEYDDLINSAIRRGRDRMIRAKVDSTLTGGSTSEYTIPSAVAAGRLGEVWYQSGASPTRYTMVDFLDWDVRDNFGSQTLRFYSANCTASGSPILLKYEAPQAELSADTDTVMPEAEEYILAHSTYRAHQQLAMRTDVDVEEHLRRAVMHKQEAEDLLRDMYPERMSGRLIKGDEHRGGATRARMKGDE